MNKRELSKSNLKVLATISKAKQGLTTTQLAGKSKLSVGGADHHLGVLKKANKIKRDKKTKVWSVK